MKSFPRQRAATSAPSNGSFAMPSLRRTSAVLGLALALIAITRVATPARALASTNQVAIIEDDPHMLTDPAASVAMFRKLGARIVRINLTWSSVAPDPRSNKRPSFNATDPGAYPAGGWAPFDAIDIAAKNAGIRVDFIISGGSPLWAQTEGGQPNGYNPLYAWYPSAYQYGLFARAVGTRYSGTYKPKGSATPLPRVSFWTIFNEPNFGEDLGPQAIDGSTIPVAPGLYRQMVNAGWSALQATGHTTKTDTILIGELAARGLSSIKPKSERFGGLPGAYSQTKPLIFIRTLYCVNGSYQELRGSAAAQVGCPTNAAGSRAFRKSNPGLFGASGFGIHPYPLAEGQSLPPSTDGPHGDPNYVTFSQLPNLWHDLDRLNSIYGSSTHFPIYNDEYGYITEPPHPTDKSTGRFVSPATAAYYINWAEYLSWKWPRLASYMQYPVWDPAPNPNIDNGVYQGFSAGLFTYAGAPKPAYYSYRLPLYLPVTTTLAGRSLEVWGDVRPAYFASLDTVAAQSVQIQFQAHSKGSFSVLGQPIKITNKQGYFDIHQKFTISGTLRLAWTYPKLDPSFAAGTAGVTVYSRTVQVTVR